MTAAHPRLDLLILDLDGTLVDSEQILVDLVNQTLALCGYAPADRRVIASAIGLPLEHVFRSAAPQTPEPEIAALCARYRERADQPEFVRQFRLYPGVAPTLDRLREAGARLVVGTSKGRSTTLDILEHCGIASVIDGVVGGDEVRHGKPHPEMVKKARSMFDTPATRTLIVGDTSFDIEMGQAAGILTCAVTYGMHAGAALRALQPDYLIEDFPSLLRLADHALDR
jgi:phosphoglycolate phosphatase